MQPQESAPLADQRIGWDAGPAGNLALDTGYRQEYRLRVARPVTPAARGTLKTRSCALKCGHRSLEIVFSAVAFHGGSISEPGEAA